MPIINHRLRAVMEFHACYDKQEKCRIIACRCAPYGIGKYIPSAVFGSFLSTLLSMLHLIGREISKISLAPPLRSKFNWVPALSPIGKLFDACWKRMLWNFWKLRESCTGRESYTVNYRILLFTVCSNREKRKLHSCKIIFGEIFSVFVRTKVYLLCVNTSCDHQS